MRMTTLASLVLASLSSIHVVAQPVVPVAPDYRALDSVLGASVTFSTRRTVDSEVHPGRGEARGGRGSTGERGGEEKKKKEDQDGGTPRASAADEPSGTLVDLLYARGGGNLLCAVLDMRGRGFGESKTIAVPVRLLRAEGSVFVLTAPADKVAALDGFDLAAARAAGLETALGRLRAAWSEAGVEIGPGEERTPVATPRAVSAVEVGAASGLADRRVFALQEEFGSLSKTILDWNAARIAFLVLAAARENEGDAEFLVPYGGVSWTSGAREDRLVVGLPPARLTTSGIEYAPGRDLVDPKVAERSLELFQIGNR